MIENLPSKEHQFNILVQVLRNRFHSATITDVLSKTSRKQEVANIKKAVIFIASKYIKLNSCDIAKKLNLRTHSTIINQNKVHLKSYFSKKDYKRVFDCILSDFKEKSGIFVQTTERYIELKRFRNKINEEIKTNKNKLKDINSVIEIFEKETEDIAFRKRLNKTIKEGRKAFVD